MCFSFVGALPPFFLVMKFLYGKSRGLIKTRVKARDFSAVRWIVVKKEQTILYCVKVCFSYPTKYPFLNIFLSNVDLITLIYE